MMERNWLCRHDLTNPRDAIKNFARLRVRPHVRTLDCAHGRAVVVVSQYSDGQ
jgi:hypothetical protein